MSSSGGRPEQRRFVGPLDFSDAADVFADLAVFSGVEGEEDVRTRFEEQVRNEVEAIVELTKEFDAFDVIELMRLREHPIVPVQALDPGYDGAATAVEIVALVILARPSRFTSSQPRSSTRPHEVIPDLHKRSKRLIRLGSVRSQAAGHVRGNDPLGRLSAEYQSYLTGVRALQYDSIQREHEGALFDLPKVDRLLADHLGFTYRQYVLVAEAVQEHYATTVTALRDQTGDIAQAARAEGRAPSQAEAALFMESMVDFMFLPGQRAVFSAEQVSRLCGLPVETVAGLLDRFSVGFQAATDPVASVTAFLNGRNPLAQAGILKDGSDYLLISSPIGGDSFRTVVEDVLKSTSGWQAYADVRKRVSESLAISALARAVGSEPAFVGLHYFAPREGLPIDMLGGGCPSPQEAGELVESDALFLIDDVALCIEVKGRAVAAQARRGDLSRLRTEIKNIFGSGTHQAGRLAALIAANAGVWTSDGWVDLSAIREVRTIVAGLDYFGPLGVALGDLAETDLLGAGPYPWITSIHDLEVISRVVDRPTEMLLYVRRRTSSGVAKHYRGADELDLFMLFLDGGLYVEDDPDHVHRRYPHTRPPRKADRTRFRESARPTRVGTFTDPLDAWMYYVEGSSPHAVEKPTFNIEADAARLIDFLADGRKPGWMRVGADLLGFSGESLARLTNGYAEVVERTCADGLPHSLTQGYASTDSYVTFFGCTVPEGGDVEREADHLRDYMRAKKHQVGADRALGLLVTHDGEIIRVLYMNDVAGPDPDLDRLGEAMGLQRTWEERRRPTSASAKKRKRQKRRRPPNE